VGVFGPAREEPTPRSAGERASSAEAEGILAGKTDIQFHFTVPNVAVKG
jgi:hypothetical protein